MKHAFPFRARGVHALLRCAVLSRLTQSSLSSLIALTTLAAIAPLRAIAASVQGLRDTPLIAADGGLTTLNALRVEGRPMLVAFWANWCVPCKEELALLSARRADLAAYELVAVNVDESSDWPAAASQMNALAWQGASLRDPGGAYFYAMNEAGDLPYAIVYRADGEADRVLKKLDASVVDALAREGDALSGNAEGQATTGQENGARAGLSASRGLSVLEDARVLFGRGDFRGRAVAANSLSLRYARGPWDVALTHDALVQKRPQTEGDGRPGSARWNRIEDDLGKSHVARMLRAGDEASLSLRVGDDHVDWMGGQLFSVRPSPLVPELDVVQGGHASYTGPRVSLQAMGGRVRRLLAPSVLQLDRDLSRDFPDNRVGGALARASLPLGPDASIYGGGGFVRAVRLRDVSAGQDSTEGQNHVGAFAGARASGINAEARASRYLRDDGNEPGHAGQVDAGTPFVPAWGVSLQGSASETRRLPELALVPALVDVLGIPLDAPDARSVRGQLRWDGQAGTTPAVGSVYVTQERSRHAPNLDVKAHTGASLALPAASAKLALYWAEGRLRSVDARTRDRAAQLTGPLFGPLSAQYLYRDVRDPLSGHQHRANLDLNLSRVFGLEEKGRLRVEAAHVWQTGQMRRTSGLDEARAAAGFVSWKSEQLTVRAGGGSEPGGVVCADGVCAQRPPLDGFLGEARFELQL